MKRVAILVAAIVFTLNINTKVFAIGDVDPSSAEVHQTTVISEATQGSTAIESTVISETAPVITISEEDVNTTTVQEAVEDTNVNTNVDEVVNEETGIMPDSMFYFFDKALENIKLFLAFDDEKKIEILSQIADERLAESENMTKEEKYELVRSTIEQFNALITKATEILPEEDKSDDLEKIILGKQLKSIEVLKNLSEKLDGNAKEAIEAVIEMQLAKKEAVANMVEKRHELNIAKKQYQAVKVGLKEAKKSEDIEAIKIAEEAVKVKEDIYKQAEEELKIAFEEKKAVKNELNKNPEKVDKKKLENKKEEPKEIKTEEGPVSNTEVKKVEETKKVEEVKKVEVKEAKLLQEVEKAEIGQVKKEAQEIKNENKQKEVKGKSNEAKENKKN